MPITNSLDILPVEKSLKTLPMVICSRVMSWDCGRGAWAEKEWLQLRILYGWPMERCSAVEKWWDEEWLVPVPLLLGALCPGTNPALPVLSNPSVPRCPPGHHPFCTTAHRALNQCITSPVPRSNVGIQPHTPSFPKRGKDCRENSRFPASFWQWHSSLCAEAVGCAGPGSVQGFCIERALWQWSAALLYPMLYQG